LRKKRYVLLIGLIGLLFFASVNPAVATEIWSDDFETGMDGWTITTGDFNVVDGHLETHYESFDVHMCRIWHESNVTVGTWSFDVLYPHSNPEPVILFMANGTDPIGAQEDDYQGYGIRIADDNLYLLKQDGDWDRGTQLLAPAELGDWIGTWTHFDITRNSTGGINIYVNATSSVAEPDISFVHTEFTYSERFVIDSHFGNTMFDNIVVDDEILITPPEPTTPTPTSPTSPTSPTDGTIPPPMDVTTMLIVAGGGIAVVVVIVVIVKMRD
jgi:hypothetical protein